MSRNFEILPYWTEGKGLDVKLARVKGYSDATLTRAYSVLSNIRLIHNVRDLGLLEAEMRVRGLPLARVQ